MTMWSVGLDVHQGATSVCILDPSGAFVKRFVYRGHPRGLADVLSGLAEPFQVCFEASCGSGALHDLLAPLARRVVVAHPGDLRLIFRSVRKNDRVDAEKPFPLPLWPNSSFITNRYASTSSFVRFGGIRCPTLG